MTHMTRSMPAVVLGFGTNTLPLIRSLGQRGIPVYCVDSRERSVGIKPVFPITSRFSKTVLFHAENDYEGNLIGCLLRLAEQLGEKAALMYCTDMTMLAVSRHRTRLAEHYAISLSNSQTIEMLNDKIQFYRFANEHQWPIPRTMFPSSARETIAMARDISFPCILKPMIRDAGWRKAFGGKKVFLYQDITQLEREVESLFAVSDRLLLQEQVMGPDSNLHFSLAYYGVKSECLGMFTGRKIRQYPIHFGTSTLTESIELPEVAEMTSRFLQSINFQGYGNIEFKKDARDGQYRIMEVTTRTWYPHGLGVYCGVDLPYVWYCDLVGLPVPTIEAQRYKVRWLDEFTDPLATISYFCSGELSLWGYLRSFRGDFCTAVWSLHDPLPFLAGGLLILLYPLLLLFKKFRLV